MTVKQEQKKENGQVEYFKHLEEDTDQKEMDDNNIKYKALPEEQELDEQIEGSPLEDMIEEEYEELQEISVMGGRCC